jgi:hypothetical protein
MSSGAAEEDSEGVDDEEAEQEMEVEGEDDFDDFETSKQSPF